MVKLLFASLMGFVLGAFLMITDRAVATQQGYIEGRQSVLNQTVSVSKGSCNISVPLSVLAEMVNVGVVDWCDSFNELKQTQKEPKE